MLSPHETFTKATHLILFLRAEDWPSRFCAARVIRVISSAKSAGPLHPHERTYPAVIGSSESCRFCCRSPLMAFANGDSVALTRFAAEASDDGAAEARSGAAFLRVSARRGDTGRSPCARDRRRARSDLGA